jgi:tryptophanyl-tRNA synthetase
MRIVTNSKEPGEPKAVDESALFPIYAAFVSVEERAEMAEKLAAGLAWGEAKQIVFECIDQELEPARERYNKLIAEPSVIEDTLLAGAEKARRYASPFMQRLRAAVGISSLV